jgi:L-fucose mutarotase/ribose pyranase (RbsD/FucU family)
MRRDGLLHPALAHLVASCGHGDLLVEESRSNCPWLAEENGPAGTRRCERVAPGRSPRAVASQARGVVRTGEFTRYANVILRCGVAFGAERTSAASSRARS